MGNCVKPVDPLVAAIPRDSGIDATAIRESGLPIIFFIGAPGVGKTTQCKNVADRFRFLSIVSTEILRNEVHSRSSRGFILARMMSQGRLVPADVLTELIKTRMLENLDRTQGFLITGFPREKEQGICFEKQVKPVDLVIYLTARNTVIKDRIMAKTVTVTERTISYNEIMDRLNAFHKANAPILRYYKKKLVVIDGEKDIPHIFEDICNAIQKALGIDGRPQTSVSVSA